MTKAQFSYFLAFIQFVCQELWSKAMSKFATISSVGTVANRVTQLEEGNGPFVLSVDYSTGQLVQTGTANGTFGIDYETGYLTFTPSSTEEETQN